MGNETAYPSDELLDEFDATMLMLGRQMSARHSEHCENTPMTGPRIIALRILSEAGSSKSGDLAALLGIKAPALSALVDGLEREGLVSREHDAQDRRVTRIDLTDEGRAALQVAEQRRREHMRTYLTVLGEDDIRTLIRIQRKLIATMIEQDA